jgi:uncharacterized Zn-binding protein involved in type VI secretion
MKKFSHTIMITKKVTILLMAVVCLVAPYPGAAQESNSTKSQKAIGDHNREANKLSEMSPGIQVSLTYPVGKSPKVFTKGWVFGARGIAHPGTKEQRDISGNVRWKGTGTFIPDQGPMSRPIFNGPGTNRITLYVEKEGRVVFEKTFTVEAVDPQGYARLGGVARCLHAHGCPGCPHDATGTIISGSGYVFIDGKPAACVGDRGIHSIVACCGTNVFVIKTGDPNVLIEGKPAARVGDQTQHCGGYMGTIVTAHGNR